VSLDAGKATSVVLSGLYDAKIHYFAVTAYDGSGNESAYSNQVSLDWSTVDTDGDGLNNWDEANLYHSNPDKADTDGDSLSDGTEVTVDRTDPTKADTDGDGFADGVEITQGSNPLDAKSIPNTSATWTNYTVTLKMWSTDDDDLGVMFRYQDANNYYRFSWDKQRAYRRLVKRQNGVFTLLAKDAVPYVQGQAYQVKIVANGTTQQVWIDGVKIFSVTDPSFATGTVALYTWADQGAYFDNVVVTDLATSAVLLSDNFDAGKLTGWTIVDEGTIGGPSKWTIANGTLVQKSNIYSDPTTTADLTKLGTYVVYANLVEIPQAQMQVVSVDSEELVGEDGSADNVLDGDPATIWHTEWYSNSPGYPHEIVIGLGGSYHVGGFRYLPRQDGSPNGTVAQFSLYVSADGVNWGSAVATGTFASDTSEKQVTFPAKMGQYVRFVALSEVNGNPWTSAAEIDVLEAW
jgi:hypothetical protein